MVDALERQSLAFSQQERAEERIRSMPKKDGFAQESPTGLF